MHDPARPGMEKFGIFGTSAPGGTFTAFRLKLQNLWPILPPHRQQRAKFQGGLSQTTAQWDQFIQKQTKFKESRKKLFWSHCGLDSILLI